MKAKPLTPEERRALIEAPIRIVSSGGRGWGGASYAHLGLGFGTRRRSVYMDGDDNNASQQGENPYADDQS